MTTLVGREGESTAPIYIVQNLASHGSINIQGEEKTASIIADVFSRTSGKKIIYAENFGGTDKEADGDRRLIQSRGPLFYFTSRLEGTTDQKRVRTRIEKFSTPSDGQLVDRNIVGFNNVGRFFLFRGLQRIRDSGVNFDYAFEGHRPQILRSLIAQQAEVTRAGNTGVTKWYEGNFDAGVLAHQDWFDKRLELQTQREPEIHAQLNTLVAEIQNERSGGVLCINAGFTHGSFIEELRQFRFKPGITPIFEEHLAVPENMPELVIDQALRRGQRVDDIVYARDLLLKRGLEQMINDAMQRGKTYVLGRNFESITNMVVDIVNGLSLEDIRRHCEQRQAFTTFARQFPSVESILFAIQ